MTSPPPLTFDIPVYTLHGDRSVRYCQVTVTEQHQVALVPPHDVYAFSLTDEAVDQLREALRDARRYAQARRAR